MKRGNGQFEAMDFGTKATTLAQETISVSLNVDLILADYGAWYARELEIRAPKKFSASKLTADMITAYFTQLLALRIHDVREKLGEKVTIADILDKPIKPNLSWHIRKLLIAPPWIEFTLSSVGVHIDRRFGIKIIPSPLKYVDQFNMLEISNTLRAFEDDGFSFVDNVFSSDINGNPDVMRLAVVEDFVMGMAEVKPYATYVASFLGLQIDKSHALAALYRVRYDDIEFIKSALTLERTLILC